MPTKRDGINMANGALASYQEQLDALDEESRELDGCREQAEATLDNTLEQLARSLVQSSEHDVVEAVAAELDMHTLLVARRDFERRRDTNERRRAVLEADSLFLRREQLLHPETGEYAVERARARASLEAARAELARFEEFEPYTWLRARGFEQREQRSALKRFWNAVTLGAHGERKRLEQCLDRFGHARFEQCVAEHARLLEVARGREASLAHWEGRYGEVQSRVDEHAELALWLDNYDAELLKALRATVADFVRALDRDGLSALHKRARPAARPLIAKLHAQHEKLRYYGGIGEYLRTELKDRRARSQSISRVKRKWSAKPWAALYGNKRKWLKTVPEMKRKGTQKRVRWIKTMRANIHDYDDYDAYSAFLYDDELEFLPYDAFAIAGEERMPYEGFSGQVLSDITEFRAEHGQEKPDYSTLRACARRAGPTETDWDVGVCDDEDADEGDEGVDDAEAALVASAALAELAEDDEALADAS
ncbi:MAG: hypothetical protein H6713_20795 [Myxococcales bacterium]|nr:hypothetical protein [Myxococcales bacterium]